MLGVAACALMLSPSSWAGRPFTTEDADVIASGACELETFGSHTRARPDPAERGTWVEAGCGIGIGTQLGLGTGRFTSGGEWSTTAALLGKTALRPLSDDSAGVTLAYALDGIGRSTRNLRHDGTAAALVVSVPHGRMRVHANLGVHRSRLEGMTRGTYALAVERLGDAGVDVGVELFGQQRESSWLGAGARYAIRRDRLFVDVSFAVQGGTGNARQLTLGLKAAF